MLPPQAPVNSQFTQNVVPPSPMAPPPVVLPEGLRALERHHQFIVYRRADKAPVNPITGIPSDKKSYQMSYQAALEAAA
jgi:hypothetical protein